MGIEKVVDIAEYLQDPNVVYDVAAKDFQKKEVKRIER